MKKKVTIIEVPDDITPLEEAVIIGKRLAQRALSGSAEISSHSDTTKQYTMPSITQIVYDASNGLPLMSIMQARSILQDQLRSLMRAAMLSHGNPELEWKLTTLLSLHNRVLEIYTLIDQAYDKVAELDRFVTAHKERNRWQSKDAA